MAAVTAPGVVQRGREAAGAWPAASAVRWVWLAALLNFALAGSTGALFRFGLLYGLPAGLQLANVRHAHSHLMLFGWATPALLALIAVHVARLASQPISRGLRGSLVAVTVASWLQYPFFLVYGYESATVAGLRLPLSVMASSVNILAWYAFGAAYLRLRRGLPRTRALRLWDLALLFQAATSLGAWGRAVLVAARIDDPFWQQAMVHLFLDLFTDGWLVLALLGLLYAQLPPVPGRLPRWGLRLLVLGLPPTFLLGVQPALLPAPAAAAAAAGAALVGVGLLASVWALWPRVSRPWRLPLAFLALKGGAELSLAIPGVGAWAEGAGLRIPYLHWLLLGFVTLGVAVAARAVWRQGAAAAYRWLWIAVIMVQASLIPLTGLWPEALAGRWALHAAAWIALLPVLAALWMLAGALSDGQAAAAERLPSELGVDYLSTFPRGPWPR